MLQFLSQYLHAKKSNKLIYRTSCDIHDHSILQTNWTIAFWPTTCEQGFSQIWGLYRKTENCDDFQFTFLSAKKDDNILWQVKKTWFCAFFANFWANTHFSEKPTSVIFLFLDSYFYAKFQKKLMNRFWAKLVTDVPMNEDTHRRLEKNEFKGPYERRKRF